VSALAPTFRELGGLARAARTLLLVQAGIALTAAACALSYGPGFDDANGSPLYLLVALVQMLVYVVTGIVVLRWIYLANVNVHALGAQAVGGPAMAVAWYFIPIACLFMPYQSMREIWKASRQPRDWEIVAAPATIGWWWFFWIAGSIAAIAAFRLAAQEAPEGAVRAGEMLTTASDLLTIPASLLLATIIAAITTMQKARRSDGDPPAAEAAHGGSVVPARE
jgi:Domain of unknown function (DUF4328)